MGVRTGAAVLLALALSAPAAAQARSETVLESDGGIEVRHVTLPSPMLPGSASHPAECDEIGYLRYRWTDAPDDPQAADAVIVGQPGAFLGAYGLDRLARNTLRRLATRGERVEWWSLDPRSVCAFDMTGILAANRARDYHVAWDYYFAGADVDGERFGGFKPDSELAYLGDMGAAQFVHDMHEIVTTELPDPEFRRTRVFCGGHSDGALWVGQFAAWDFGGGVENAGFNQCAGLFAAASVASADPGGVKDDPLTKLASDVVMGRTYEAAVAAMRTGALPRTFSNLPLLNPEWWTLLAIAGNAAYYRPDEETDLNELAARVLPLELSTRLGFSRTHVDFLTGLNSVRDFRFTNEAFLGMLIDDNALNIGLFQFSLGALSGGPVAPKEFPWPDPVVKQIPALGDFLTGALTGTQVRVGPTSREALYTWRAYDDVAGVPFTAPQEEVVEIGDFARQLTAAPVGLVNPYFPARYELVDNFLIQGGARSGDLAPMRYDAEAKAEPTLTLWGTDDQERYLFGSQLPEDTVYVEGYNHFDPPFGAERQNSGEPEPFSENLAGFISGHLP